MDDLKKTEVFAAYYEKVYRELYYFALHTLKNPQDAEDAVSETVTDAFAAVEKLRDNEKFRAWIFQILSNKCRRKLKEYTQKTVELPDDLPAGDTTEESLAGARGTGSSGGNRTSDHLPQCRRRIQES